MNPASSSSEAEEVFALADRYQLDVYKKLPIVVQRAEDVWVFSSDGQRYLDLYGGHAVCITGHSHPKVVEAIQRQCRQLLFYSNVVYSDVRAQAARLLVESTPDGLEKVFFVNSGAEANENALKLARKMTGRRQVVSFQGGFHGRTLGALSATGIESCRTGIDPLVPDHLLIPFDDLEAVEQAVDERTAAVILEPIQSMAGVRMASPEFYQGLRRICDRSGALLIYDEIQTGMGRVGEMLFAGRYGVMPDVVTLAKGLASGVPMGAVLFSSEAARRIGAGDAGSTFGGSPLACAALIATLEAIRDEGMLENVQRQSAYLRERLEELPQVSETLGEGFLVGVRFQGEARPHQRWLLENRILTGLSGDPQVLRLLPPLTLQEKEIDRTIEVLSRRSQPAEGGGAD